MIKHATLHKVTHAHFYQALTLNNATIKCEQQRKHKTVLQKSGKIHLNGISLTTGMDFRILDKKMAAKPPSRRE